MNQTLEPYLTIGRFAKAVGISVPSILGHINRGNIRTVNRNTRAIPVSELERFLATPKDKFGRRQIQKAGRVKVSTAPVESPLDLSAKPC
jgi:hypothetical protein